MAVSAEILPRNRLHRTADCAVSHGSANSHLGRNACSIGDIRCGNHAAEKRAIYVVRSWFHHDARIAPRGISDLGHCKRLNVLAREFCCTGAAFQAEAEFVQMPPFTMRGYLKPVSS